METPSPSGERNGKRDNILESNNRKEKKKRKITQPVEKGNFFLLFPYRLAPEKGFIIVGESTDCVGGVSPGDNFGGDCIPFTDR